MVHSHPVVIPARLPPLGLIRPSRLITAAQGPRDRVHVQHVARLELGKASAGPCSRRTPAAQPSAPRPCVPRLPGAGCSPRRPRLAPGIPLPACLLRRGLQCACEAYLVALWLTGLWRTGRCPSQRAAPGSCPCTNGQSLLHDGMKAPASRWALASHLSGRPHPTLFIPQLTGGGGLRWVLKVGKAGRRVSRHRGLGNAGLMPVRWKEEWRGQQDFQGQSGGKSMSRISIEAAVSPGH